MRTGDRAVVPQMEVGDSGKFCGALRSRPKYEFLHGGLRLKLYQLSATDGVGPFLRHRFALFVDVKKRMGFMQFSRVLRHEHSDRLCGSAGHFHRGESFGALGRIGCCCF